MIAMYMSYDGATSGMVAYEQTTAGWKWMGGFSNYVDPAKVRAYAAANGKQIIGAIPKGGKAIYA